MTPALSRWFLEICLSCLALAPAVAAPTVLRYAHPNEESSVAGRQAAFFAARVAEYSQGSLSVELFPASQVGGLEAQLSEVQKGRIAIHHQTAAGIGSSYPDFALLDTPYIYRDVAQLLRVARLDSPVMARLSAGLLETSGLRVLYTFYFGTRQLTCDRPVRRPEDLKGVKIRSVPYPLYSLAVEALGGNPVALDWYLTPTALATKSVSGQENPVNTILNAKLWQTQPWIMLTGHIIGAEIVVVNEGIWKGLSRAQRSAMERAAREAGEWATATLIAEEARDLAELSAKGMKILGPADGLDLSAFRKAAAALVRERYGTRWEAYYRLISAE